GKIKRPESDRIPNSGLRSCLNYMSNFIGSDQNNVQFFHMDITKDRLPTGDLILCRDCLVHFSLSDIHSALNNFKAGESSYLLTTTFTNLTFNQEIITGSWRPLNLEIEPFNFPKPILVINENFTEGEMNYTDKSLALWDLNIIKF
ncbi:class I SAM-dependent methyltransferase, partial [Peribacillus frigoritolerans]